MTILADAPRCSSRFYRFGISLQTRARWGTSGIRATTSMPFTAWCTPADSDFGRLTSPHASLEVWQRRLPRCSHATQLTVFCFGESSGDRESHFCTVPEIMMLAAFSSGPPSVGIKSLKAAEARNQTPKHRNPNPKFPKPTSPQVLGFRMVQD